MEGLNEHEEMASMGEDKAIENRPERMRDELLADF